MDLSPKATVLILEDEPILRQSMARALRREGYDAHEAESRDQARIIAEGFRGPIALLLCDLELQGLQGREAALMLQSLHPEMRVLFMGRSPGTQLREQLEKIEPVFLRKPIDRQRLLALVGLMLEGWKSPT